MKESAIPYRCYAYDRASWAPASVAVSRGDGSPTPSAIHEPKGVTRGDRETPANSSYTTDYIRLTIFHHALMAVKRGNM
jgi:hypothetical protein